MPVRETLLVNTLLFSEILELLPRRKMKHARIHCFEFTGEETEEIWKRLYHTKIYKEDRLYFAFRYYSVLDYKTLINDITVYFLTREDILKGRGIHHQQKFGRVVDWESELKEYDERVFF